MSPSADRPTPKAVIFGCAGPELTAEEIDFFAETNPFGFILFARNCENSDQLKALAGRLRQAIGDPVAPILIDQEGGRVARLRPPHWRLAPAAAKFGELYGRDRSAGLRAAEINARLIADELRRHGITVDCLPVLDVPVAGAHDAIGDRAFGRDPATVTDLGRAAISGLLAGGVVPVVKHMPGQGRAMVDSHLALPIVEATLDELSACDLQPFQALCDQTWGMTGHVLFPVFDGDRPTTLSPTVIEEVIRGRIGFDGLLLTDDLNMEALSGDVASRAAAALAAGCDIALHCSGNMSEMKAVSGAVDVMTEKAVTRSRAIIPAEQPISGQERAAMENQLTAMLGLEHPQP